MMVTPSSDERRRINHAQADRYGHEAVTQYSVSTLYFEHRFPRLCCMYSIHDHQVLRLSALRTMKVLRKTDPPYVSSCLMESYKSFIGGDGTPGPSDRCL